MVAWFTLTGNTSRYQQSNTFFGSVSFPRLLLEGEKTGSSKKRRNIFAQKLRIVGCIWEIISSSLGRHTDITSVFAVLFHLSRQNRRHYFRLGHIGFLPYSLIFVIYHHLTLYNPSYEKSANETQGNDKNSDSKFSQNIWDNALHYVTIYHCW